MNTKKPRKFLNKSHTTEISVETTQLRKKATNKFSQMLSYVKSTTARLSTDDVENDQGNLHVDVENDQESLSVDVENDQVNSCKKSFELVVPFDLEKDQGVSRKKSLKLMSTDIEKN
ncbi:1122_t:CDS:2 [Funneliformis caledonium]|uniref:1122_t:CDS:1 n=1 Tax=Funneliformis caledonium TaxID=1117310 RepID=A0A9N8W6J1_9GLOM|nr:1122_t:CDS:2 [Funneliformis caledonium]